MTSREVASEGTGSQTSIETKSNTFFWWTRPGTSQEEVKLVRKLDLCLLTYCCLSFFCKDLDRNNVSNAYMSGMKEDLGLHGNELNWFTTYYQIGYIIGQIPSNILLTKISPRYYLPGAEFIWSLLVLFLYKVKSAEQIYVMRFFIGMVEATCWPGLHFMVGSWYRNHEINKRTGIFTASGIAATMFSGYIRSGIYTSMNGALGLAGWRWLFITDFVISLPLLVFGVVFIPNPITSKAKSWWMTYREKELAIERLATDKRAPLGKLDLTIFKRVLGRWRFWIMAILVAWFVPTGAKYFAFWIAGTIQATIPIVVSWTHEVCSRDAERAIVVASLNSIGVAQGTWWNQVFVKTTSAPRFKLGYRAGLAVAIVMTAWLPVVEFFDRRQKNKEALEEVVGDVNGNDGSSQGSLNHVEKGCVRTTGVEM
ncbi:pantothenate transporter [Sclerotinia borealis F-4128]|uniref:Pantothenate transporter n=1 Tax=Sclerotinia borealis (strain F-4128) TaxID=1432307 RepID=W9CNR9_SCLBF|nr:pantothenate transporter [Sclerotinia borealis F-4128]